MTFGLDGAHQPTSLAVADLDDDGRLDVATANVNSAVTDIKDVSVLRNTTPPPPAPGAQIVARVPAYSNVNMGGLGEVQVTPSYWGSDHKSA